MKKQHVEPGLFDKFSIWKQYILYPIKRNKKERPIIAGSDAKDPLRIKYNHWVDIKRNIEDKVKDFDKKSHQIQAVQSNRRRGKCHYNSISSRSNHLRVNLNVQWTI